MRNKFKIIFISSFIFLLSSCSGNKKDDFDFSDLKIPVKESINNEAIATEDINSNNVQYELKPLKEKEEVISSFKFEKNDPFSFDSQSSSELSGIKLKGFITISNEKSSYIFMAIIIQFFYCLRH